MSQFCNLYSLNLSVLFLYLQLLFLRKGTFLHKPSTPGFKLKVPFHRLIWVPISICCISESTARFEKYTPLDLTLKTDLFRNTPRRQELDSSQTLRPHSSTFSLQGMVQCLPVTDLDSLAVYSYLVLTSAAKINLLCLGPKDSSPMCCPHRHKPLLPHLSISPCIKK